MLYKRGTGCSAPAESKMETRKLEFCDGLRVNDRILIKGKLKAGSGSFQVALCYEDRNITPLHLEAQYGETLVVLFGTRRNKQPGDKIEIDKKFPSGEDPDQFKIIIDVTGRHFEIAVNENPSRNFTHKLGFKPIKFLEVTGDVVVDPESGLIPRHIRG